MKKSLLLMLFLALTWSWTANAQEILTFDFEDGQIPGTWANDATYPWVAVTTDPASTAGHYIKSSNEGVGSSTSSISASFIFVGDGSISFDGGCWGEGTSTAWDKCIFEIDGVQQFAKGEANPRWENYSYIVEAGTHTFTWKYSKDSSVNPTGDAFFLGNVVVNLGVAPACPKPTNISASGISSSQATIAWVSESSDFEIVWSDDADFDPNAVTATQVSSQSYIITGLNASTDYFVYVRTICGSENSVWSSKYSFTTPCAAKTIPYSYGFETVDDFECWTPIAGAARSNSYSHEGSYSLKFSGTTSNLIVLPQFSAAINTLRLEFWTRPESSGGSSGKFAVGYMTDITDASTFVAVETYNSTVWASSPAYEKKVVDFNNAPAGAIIALRQFDCYTNYYWFVDDVTVQESPSCLAPTALGAENITTNSTDLSWTANSSESVWRLFVKKASEENYVEENGIITNPYTLQGLEPATEYQYYVIAKCGGSDESEPSDAFSFITGCEAIDLSAASWSENFDSYTAASGFLPICWNRINTCTYSYYGESNYPKVSNYGANTSPNCLYLYSYYSDWSDYDPQPQYAILPEMSDLAGKQITLQAKGYNTSSTFKIGTMADPADATTFHQIAEQTGLTTAYQEYVFDISNTTDSYVAIMIDAADENRTTNGVYIDDIVIANPPTCFKPTDLIATLTPGDGTVATLSWTVVGTETAWQICLDGNEENLIDATTNPCPLSGLAPETVHTAKVRAYCDATDQSEWSNAISFEPTAKIIIGSGTGTTNYLPSNTSYDYSLTQQIFTVEELGDAGLIESIDFYMTSDNDYTRNLDIYIVSTDKESFESTADWVPVSANNLVFSGEVDFAAQAWTTITLDNGFIYHGTDNVVIVVDDNTGSWSGRYFKSFTASNQALYKYQDDTDIPVNYTGSGSLGASKNQIRILKGELPACAKPTGLASSEIGKTSVTLSWAENGEATTWDIMLNNDAENLVVANTNPFVLNGLSAETDYVVTVRANCGGTQSEWSNEINFTTLQACPAPTALAVEAGSETAHGATISWNGDADSYNVMYGIPAESVAFSADFEDNAINKEFTNSTTYPWIVTSDDKHDGTYSVKSGNEGANSSSSELSLVIILSGGGSISFWAKISSEGSYDKGYFYIDDVAKVNGISGAGSWIQYNYNLTAGEHTLKWKYTKDSSTASNDDCFYLDDIQVVDNIVSSWATISDVESPYTFTTLQEESTYQVKVQSVCGGTPGHESGTVSFTTAAGCQMPDGLAVSNITASSAEISWNAYGQKGFNLRYSVDGTNWTSATSENSPYSLTSLDPNTSYEVQVQPTCAGADEWSASLNFKTECEAITITFNAPYVEDFEDPIVTTTYNQAGQMPDCWEGYPATYAGPKILAAGKSYNYASSGQVLYFYGSGNNYAVLPKISNPLSDLQISFKWATESSSNGTLTLGHIADNDEDFNTFKAIKAFPASSASYRQLVQENIFLDTLPASASKLVFRWYYSGQYGCNVDDIIIRLANIVDINASEYATYFNSEKAYIMPAGVTGHAFANGVLSDAVYQSADVVPAAIPLVLHGPAGSYLLASSSEAGAPLSVANDLIGVNIETEIEDESGYLFYVLSLNAANDVDSVGFYWMNATGAGGFTLPAHKAYLKYGASSAPAAFYLFNGENGATWLDNLEGVEGTVKFMHEGNIYILRDSIIYDATGRKVRELK